jgi:DNA-binding NarL/FixJ family response regulator
MSAEDWEILRRSLGLSLLQTEVIRRVFEGKSHQQIAREMALRPRTVRTVVSRLYRQFGASGRIQLILRILAVWREHWEEGKAYPSP